MKKYCLTLLFFLYVASLSAQDIKWSSVLEDKDYNYLKIIGQNEDGFYVLKSNISFDDDRDRIGFRGRHYSLSFFSGEMILKWTHAIEAPMEDGKIVSVNIVNEKALVTYSYADKKQKTFRLFAQYLNSSGGYADSARIIYEAAYNKIHDRTKPAIYISQSQNRIAAVCRVATESKEEQAYHVTITDTTLSTIYEKDLAVPFDEDQFISQNLVLSNDGGFYLFGIRYTNDKKVKAPAESFYMMYYCNNAGSEVRSEEIRIDEKFLTDASLTFDNMNHKIVVAGFYSDVSAYSVAGTFYYALRTDTAQQADVRLAVFDQRFLSRFRGEMKENNNKELVDYSINRIILRRDGGVVVIAEGISYTSSSYYDYFSQMYITHKYYTYGNIIALSVNPNGSMLWSEVISKSQESQDDGGYYSSYANTIYEDKMFFAYNKYIRDSPSVLITTVNSTGNQKTDVLFNEEDHVLAIPSGGKQISEDEIVMPALKEGKMRFVKITF